MNVRGVLLAAYAPSKLKRSSLGAFFGAAAVCACLIMAYDQACFGSPWAISYANRVPTPFVTDLDHGLVGFTGPNAFRLISSLGSVSRGLFFISPILLYCLPGFFQLSSNASLRREFWLIAGASTLTLLMVSSFQGWHGGTAFGPRYLTVILPFLVVPLAFAADGSGLFFAALGLSIFQIACAHLGCPHTPEAVKNPIAEFILPLMREGVVAISWAGKSRFLGPRIGGLLQYLFFLGLAALALFGQSRSNGPVLSWKWKGGICVWATYVIVMLVFSRTASENTIRWSRALALHEYADITKSPTMERTAIRTLIGVDSPDQEPADFSKRISLSHPFPWYHY